MKQETKERIDLAIFHITAILFNLFIPYFVGVLYFKSATNKIWFVKWVVGYIISVTILLSMFAIIMIYNYIKDSIARKRPLKKL